MCPTSKHTMNMLGRHLINTFILLIASALAFALPAAIAADDIYGPTNLLKTMKTPFSFSQQKDDIEHAGLKPLSLGDSRPRSLSNRLLPPRLYLPGRMVIGQTSEFIVKGRSGAWVALAMADKDTGAKAVLGHELHLGPDRKVVAIGQIPETGVLSLVINTPIQGDLIGDQLYFEAAIWSKDDFSDLELAAPVPSDTTTGVGKTGKINGVTMAGEPEKKRGVRFVPEGLVPAQMLQGSGSKLDSGRP